MTIQKNDNKDTQRGKRKHYSASTTIRRNSESNGHDDDTSSCNLSYVDP